MQSSRLVHQLEGLQTISDRQNRRIGRDTIGHCIGHADLQENCAVDTACEYPIAVVDQCENCADHRGDQTGPTHDAAVGCQTDNPGNLISAQWSNVPAACIAASLIPMPQSVSGKRAGSMVVTFEMQHHKDVRAVAIDVERLVRRPVAPMLRAVPAGAPKLDPVDVHHVGRMKAGYAVVRVASGPTVVRPGKLDQLCLRPRDEDIAPVLLRKFRVRPGG